MPENPENTEKNKFNFSFHVQNYAFAPFTHLKLFNGYNEVVSEGYGNMDIQIPKGLYQLRIEINEHVEDRNYRVTGDITDKLTEIHTASSIPVEGFSTTHEYFSGPSSYWSKRSTITQQEISGNSLFLFLRYSDNEKAFDKIPDPENGFIIVNENRENVYTLDKKNTRSDFGKHLEYFGCVSFHEKLEPGQYYLIYKGKKNQREIPVYIFAGWQTQLYIMIKDFPLFNTLKISIERDSFSFQGQQNLQLDALIQKMYNGIYFLPEQLKEYAAVGKWENPMLGILACYMYLLSDDTKDDTLFKTILDNLQGFILNNVSAPDLVALRLLGAVHFKKEIPTETLTAPCMIVAGMNAFLKQSFTNEQLIKEDSIVEEIFKNLVCDSIWTTYKPLPIKTKKNQKQTTVPLGIPKAKKVTTRSYSEGNASKSAFKFNPKNDWITCTIFDHLSQTNKPIDVKTIAAQMQVTSNTVKASLNKLNESGNLKTIADSIFGSDSSKKEFKNTIGKVSSNIKNMKF